MFSRHMLLLLCLAAGGTLPKLLFQLDVQPVKHRAFTYFLQSEVCDLLLLPLAVGVINYAMVKELSSGNFKVSESIGEAVRRAVPLIGLDAMVKFVFLIGFVLLVCRVYWLWLC